MQPTSFAPFSIDTHAFPAVVKAGSELYGKRQLKGLQSIGADILATFAGVGGCTAVISQKGEHAVQYTCTCGYRYGGACEHVVAAMLAINQQQVVQVGLDFDSPPPPPAAELIQEQPQPSPEPISAEVEELRPVPKPRLYLSEHNGMFLVEPRFGYDDGCGGVVEFSRRDQAHEWLVTGGDGVHRRIVRAKAGENVHMTTLLQSGLTSYGNGQYTPAEDAHLWLELHLGELGGQGFEIFGQERLLSCKVRSSKPTLAVSMRTEGQFLSCTMDVAIEGIRASMAEVFEAALGGRRYIRLCDGSTGIIPEEWLTKISDLLALYESSSAASGLKVRRTSAPAVLDVLQNLDATVRTDEEVIDYAAALNDFEGIAVQPLPQSLRAELRSYQQAGYDWFHFLQRFGLGGCLADDMGLGKTVQTLTLLLSQKEQQVTPRTSLLIVPTSLLFNWERESQKFTPALRILRYHGPDRKRYSTVEMAFADVVLTTYGTVLRDSELIKNFLFNYIILDEAQAIKNPLSGNSQKIRKLRCRHRLALSGTPIENGLAELWSLFAFINPGMLGSYRHFATTFAKPIQADPTDSKAELLRKLINPCVMRRTKGQVAKDLPPKTETILYSDMEPAQQTLYEITRDMYRTQLTRDIDTRGMDQTRMDIVQGLLRLRQICCHPLLVDKTFSGGSGKYRQLLEQLDDLIAGGHKVLIFSQFVSALELLRANFAKRGIRNELLSGKSSNREKLVDSFQNDPSIPLMLISLKAGGTGLNLTAADYVVHLDPWWNPAAEAQASDRAYRIGQTRPVFVYKMITRNSVEERVLAMQQSKRALFDAVITTENSVVKSLTRADVVDLFS
jgi:non-specific serine/threonine protein kinase